jgi:uncharacterized protein (DUF2062 family)
MGIVPLWGFQMMIALALSFAFRLNKALVIIAANVSIPPMIPLILFLSHITGAFWMGEQAQNIPFTTNLTLDILKANLTQYIAGAISLATLSGLLTGLLTYALLKLLKRP